MKFWLSFLALLALLVATNPQEDSLGQAAEYYTSKGLGKTAGKPIKKYQMGHAWRHQIFTYLLPIILA